MNQCCFCQENESKLYRCSCCGSLYCSKECQKSVHCNTQNNTKISNNFIQGKGESHGRPIFKVPGEAEAIVKLNRLLFNNVPLTEETLIKGWLYFFEPAPEERRRRFSEIDPDHVLKFVATDLLKRIINELNERNQTFLYVAALSLDIEIFDHLLHVYGIDKNLKNKDGNTPVHAAAWTVKPIEDEDLTKEQWQETKHIISGKKLIFIGELSKRGFDIWAKNNGGDTFFDLLEIRKNRPGIRFKRN